MSVLAAEQADTRVRALWVARQDALARARGYRLRGQLVPGSLREEIAENGRDFRWALASYARANGIR